MSEGYRSSALHCSLYTRVVADHVFSLLGGSDPGRGRLLDAGFGAGYFLERIHQTWPGRFELHGTEVDPRSVAAVAKSVPGRFAIGSVTRMEYPDDFFDLVLNLSVLEHVQDDERAMDELARVLGPGGRLIVSVPCLHGWRSLSRLRNLGHESPGHPEYHFRPGYSAQDLIARFTRRGLDLRGVCYGLFFVSELMMDAVKWVYFSTANGLDSQTEVGGAGASPIFRLYRALFPLLYALDRLENRLFPFRDKGHVLTLDLSKPK